MSTISRWRVQPRLDLILPLQAIAEELFAATRPLRVNIRIAATNDPDLPVLAEVLDEGAFSLTGGMSQLGYKYNDIHVQPTVSHLRASGPSAMIVQRDTSVDFPVVSVARKFGGQAGQMLTGLWHNGEFVGLIAVHSHDEPRDWAASDIDALKNATDATQTAMEAAVWFDFGSERER